MARPKKASSARKLHHLNQSCEIQSLEAKIRQGDVVQSKIKGMIQGVTTDFRSLFTTKVSMALCATLMVYMSHLSVTTTYGSPNVYSKQEKQQVGELFGVSFKTAKRLFDAARSLAFHVRKEAEDQESQELTRTTSKEAITEETITAGDTVCEASDTTACGTTGDAMIGGISSDVIGETGGRVGVVSSDMIGETGGRVARETVECTEIAPAEMSDQASSRIFDTQQIAACISGQVERVTADDQTEDEHQNDRTDMESERIDDPRQSLSVSEPQPQKTGDKESKCMFDIVIERYPIPNREEERKQQKEQRDKERVEWLRALLEKSECVMSISRISEEAKKHFTRWGSVGSVYKLVKKYFRYVHYRITPYLTDIHRSNRCQFAQAVGVKDNGHLYEKALEVYWDETTLVVHIDEKWYRSHRLNVRCLILKGMPPPVIHVKSKTHVPQVMIFAAVCRPVVRNGEVLFDGKIMWFPLVVKRDVYKQHDTPQRW